jgi:predicted nuclease of predicted toxin-antitoxin system
MKILMDECVPRGLKRALVNHKCSTVPEAGFAGKENGELLTLAQQHGFDVFLTVDKGFEFQQNLKNRPIAVLIMRGISAQIEDLLDLVPQCLSALATIKPGEIVRVDKR